MLNGNGPKRDENEKAIVAALRQVGAVVAPISAKGVPDLLVGFRGQTFLLEVKVQKKKLNPVQVAFHESWNGSAIAVVHSEEEALKAIGAIG